MGLWGMSGGVWSGPKGSGTISNVPKDSTNESSRGSQNDPPNDPPSDHMNGSPGPSQRGIDCVGWGGGGAQDPQRIPRGIIASHAKPCQTPSNPGLSFAWAHGRHLYTPRPAGGPQGTLGHPQGPPQGPSRGGGPRFLLWISFFCVSLGPFCPPPTLGAPWGFFLGVLVGGFPWGDPPGVPPGDHPGDHTNQPGPDQQIL